MNLVEQFGNIDIYLFDQLLRGNISPAMKVLDAGCGGGRNLVYLLREGCEVFGVDARVEAIEHLRSVASTLAPNLPAENFRVETVEAMSFPDESVDVVLSNAVLHFARDDAHFEALVHSMWRRLRPGGLFFCRLSSTIGLEHGHLIQQIVGRRFLMPSGMEWYLADEALLMRLTQYLGGELVDPLKTTVVQGVRCMTTWVVRKRA
ncbi:MAG: class I SAM-dependent methyltransferase [Edaphobacter sp.]